LPTKAGAHEPQAKQHRRASARICSNFGMKQLRVAETRHTWEEFGRRRRRGLDAVGNFDGICGVLTLSSWNRRRRGARGNPGSHHAIDAELGRAPEEAGSFIPPRTRCCSNHHQSSSQPVTADAERRLLLLGSGSVRARSRRPPAGDDGREVCGVRVAG
jgi:hypothetical protein